MAPEPTEMEEEVPSYSTNRDDVTAVVTSRILNLRFYPTGSGDEEDGDLDQLFEDSNEDNEFVSGTATGREKAVKFAEDIAEQREAHLDKERSRKELLTKINRLTDTLKDAEKALEVEREKRKKKERNLLKLAKELKKRNQKRDSDLERMEELEAKKRYLEHHWVLAQKELDQEKALRAKNLIEAQQEHEQTLKDEKERHAKAVEEHEVRLADLKRSHERQYEELGRALLKQKLEADRLFNELAANGIRVSRNALFLDEKKQYRLERVLRLFTICVTFAFVITLGWAYQANVLTKNGICSPVMPGTVFDVNSQDSSHLSPWWAPDRFKQKAYAIICTAQTDTTAQPSSLQWEQTGKFGRLSVNLKGQTTVKKNVVKAEILSDRMRLWKRNGPAEEESSNW